MAAVNTRLFDHEHADSAGHTLRVHGQGNATTITMLRPGIGSARSSGTTIMVDAEGLVDLAHSLLERAVVELDCDEITDAVEALRRLERRTCEHEHLVEQPSGSDRPYVVCIACQAIVDGPEPF